jgi:UDP-glucose 4-epimerase
VLESQVLELVLDDSIVWEKEPLERLAQEGQLAAYRHSGFWQCMDTLRDVRLLQSFLREWSTMVIEGLAEGMEAYNWESEFGNRFAKRKVLVTGATGFVGRHLCDALTSLSAQVYGLDVAKGVEPNLHRLLITDLKDAAVALQVVSEIRPDLIYHLAGLVTAGQDANLVIPMLQNNLVGTVNLLSVALSVSCQRVVVAGSSEEIGSTYTDGVPTSPYGAAKAASTMYAKMFHRLYDLPVVVVRPFMTFGPRQNPTKLVPYVIASLLRNEPPRLNSGKRVVDVLYIMDLVRGFLKVGITPSIEGKVIDLGTGKGILLENLVDVIVKLTGSAAYPMVEEEAERVEEYPQIADLKQTQQMIDWKPLWSLEQGLIETIDWHRARVFDPMEA